tara:strand:+ start:731 stop:2449 length:1719 start_codon:yes stop_codon:yes gene_type:complete
MVQIISLFAQLYSKYLLFYFFLFLFGRSFVLIIQKLLFNSNELPKNIFKLKPSILYPLIGLVFLGNFLIIINFFLPLKDVSVLFLLGSILLINLFNIKLKIDLPNLLSLDNFLFYIVIPSILIISSSTTNFHYDAGYYHLNHQNWLRESNLIVGMVNIFWPFGMSSINEYISSILWIDSSFILLHFLTLFFIHFFFIFISYNILSSKNKNLKAASIFLLLFSFLDNFGASGGRNGFPYIQGVGKQDIAVGVLFCFLSLIMLNAIKQKEASKIDFVVLSLFTFFIFQLKVSGVIIFFLYFVFCFFLIRNEIFKFKNIFYLQIPTIFFGVVWSVKSYLTTGCIIFPLSLTCINNFDWYLPNSTKAYEEISTISSLAYMEYFVDKNLTFTAWFNDFFLSEIYADLSLFYRSVYLNFLISIFAIYIFKLIFFNKESSSKSFNLMILLYLISSFLYLLFFGPIPRYAMGTLLTIVGIFGFYSKNEKFNLNRYLIYFLITICVGLIPRANSYIEFLTNPRIAVSDPRIEQPYIEIQTHENWVKPDRGDRCWINLKCTMHREDIYISEESFFKVAYRIK